MVISREFDRPQRERETPVIDVPTPVVNTPDIAIPEVPEVVENKVATPKVQRPVTKKPTPKPDIPKRLQQFTTAGRLNVTDALGSSITVRELRSAGVPMAVIRNAALGAGVSDRILRSLGISPSETIGPTRTVTTTPPATPPQANIEQFRADAARAGATKRQIATELALIRRVGAEEYNKLGRSFTTQASPAIPGTPATTTTTPAPAPTFDVNGFAQELKAAGYSVAEIKRLTMALRSDGLPGVKAAYQGIRLTDTTITPCPPTPKVEPTPNVEPNVDKFSADLAAYGYSPPEITERLRVLRQVGVDKYPTSVIAGVPPLAVIERVKKNQLLTRALERDLERALATEQAALAAKKREYPDYWTEALAEAPVSIREREQRWLDGKRSGFQDNVSPVLQKWQGSINGDEWTGTKAEFQQFMREYDSGLKNSWRGTIPDVVDYLENKLETARLVAPKEVPAIEAGLQRAIDVSAMEPSFGRTGAGTAVLISTLVLLCGSLSISPAFLPKERQGSPSARLVVRLHG